MAFFTAEGFTLGTKTKEINYLLWKLCFSVSYAQYPT